MKRRREKGKLAVTSRWPVIFTLAILIPCAILVLLGLQALRDESLIVEKKLEQEYLGRAQILRASFEELVLAAERKLLGAIEAAEAGGKNVDGLARDLARLETGGGIIGCFFVIDSGGEVLLPAVRPLYVEGEGGRRVDMGPAGERLKEARTLELRDRDYARAVEAFERAFEESGEPREKAESLLGIARCRLKGGDVEKAIGAYAALADAYPALRNPAGFPYALVARHEKARALARLSRPDEAMKEALQVYGDLTGRTWDLAGDQYLYLSDLLRGQVEELAASGAEQDRRIYARLSSREAEELELTRVVYALKRYFPEGFWDAGEVSGAGATEVVAGSDEAIVYMACRAGEMEGIAGFIIELGELRSSFIPRQLEKMGLGGESVAAVVDGSGEVVAAGGELPGGDPSASQPLGRYLPGWRVQIYHARPESRARVVTLRKRVYTALLVPLFLIILLGLFFLGAGIRREMRLARMKADFVSTVSHELKSPLTSIRMFGEMLQMGRVASPAQRKKYYEIITSESNRLQQLIDNILDFSRMEEGKKEYHFEKCDLARVVAETVEAYQYAVSHNGYRITVEEPDPLPEMELDKDAVSQAVLNLLSNAVKFSKEDKRIDVRVLRGNGNAVVEVEDRGAGIDEGELERIFEKFYRAGDVLTRETRGTGLGLTIVRHIAEAHGGRVDVRSAKGAGSTFSIIVPIRRSGDAEDTDSRG